jgi:hypothetical protein
MQQNSRFYWSVFPREFICGIFIPIFLIRLCWGRPPKPPPKSNIKNDFSGRLICDEALLTGESVPQVKEGVDQLDLKLHLDQKEHQVSLVSGGTKILQHIPPQSVIGSYKPTDKGCPALVLRTGFSTTQGKDLKLKLNNQNFFVQFWKNPPTQFFNLIFSQI